MTIVPLSFKFARAHRYMRVRLREWVRFCQGKVRGLMHPYQPEFHYMRGPGPKWREKNGGRAGTKH